MSRLTSQNLSVSISAALNIAPTTFLFRCLPSISDYQLAWNPARIFTWIEDSKDAKMQFNHAIAMAQAHRIPVVVVL